MADFAGHFSTRPKKIDPSRRKPLIVLLFLLRTFHQFHLILANASQAKAKTQAANLTRLLLRHAFSSRRHPLRNLRDLNEACSRWKTQNKVGKLKILQRAQVKD